ARQRPDDGRRAVTAQRRRQGQRVGALRALRNRGLHRAASDDAHRRRDRLSLLSAHHSLSDASAAPSEIAASLANTISLITGVSGANVANPQSVLATTRSF